MQGQSPEEKVHPDPDPVRDERDHPIEGAATGATGGDSDPVPKGDPDPTRPPYGGPMGGTGSKND